MEINKIKKLNVLGGFLKNHQIEYAFEAIFEKENPYDLSQAYLNMLDTKRSEWRSAVKTGFDTPELKMRIIRTIASAVGIELTKEDLNINTDFVSKNAVLKILNKYAHVTEFNFLRKEIENL